MKKLILLSLLFFSLAQAVPPPPICQDNKWFEIIARSKVDSESEKLYGYSKPMIYCVLPNGEYYSPWALYQNKDIQYKSLINQFSGKSPSIKQIQKAKEQIRKEGYIVD